MKQYWITFVAVAILNGVVGMIAPEGDIKKYVRLLGALCLLCAVVQPILGWSAEGGEWTEFLWGETEETVRSDYDEIYNQSLLQGGEKNAEILIKNRILEKFELSDESVDVRVNFAIENEKVRLEEICLTIRKEAVLVDPRILTEYINEAYACSCTVVYDS
jgi:hypothetical protein